MLSVAPDLAVEGDPAAIGGPLRSLPTARELAECHSEEELKRLRGVATSIADIEAAQLFEAATKERRRIEVETSLRRPQQWRQAEAEKREYHERYLKERAALEGALMPRAGMLIGQGVPFLVSAPGPSASAQSFGPSE